MQPQQQGTLGGITQGSHTGRIAVVKECRAIAGDALPHDGARLIIGEAVASRQAIEMGLIDLHLVLGEGSRLVSADDSRCAHRLTGVHATHQVIVLQHLAHTQCEGQSDAHGQSLGHRNDNQRHGQHHRLDEVLGIGHDTLAARDEKLDDTSQHQQARHDITAAGNRAPQAVELLRERRLDVIVDLGITIDLAILGLVAHTLDTHGRTALDDSAGTQQHRGRIGRFGRSGGGLRVVGLPGRRFAREGTLIDGKIETVDDSAVGRDFLASLENHDVAHHDVTAWHLGDVPVAHHLDHDVVIGLIEQAEFLVGIHLDQETHQRGKHHGNEDSQRLKEDAEAHAKFEKLIQRQADGQQQRHQQDSDERIVKFLEELPP